MIQAAFTTFDQDEDGLITSDEMVEILTGSGSTMSKADAQDMIDIFDEDKDKALNAAEFAAAWGMFGSFFQETVNKWGSAQVEKTNALYDECVRPFKDKIKSVFEKLDADKNGVLSIGELREVLVVYQGEEFDEGTFFQWHDVHGRERHRGAGGMVDLHEFGWYIADCAECRVGTMDLVVNEFFDAADYVVSRTANAPAAEPPAPAPVEAAPKTSRLARALTFRSKGGDKSSMKKKWSAYISRVGLKLNTDAAGSQQALADSMLELCGGDKAKAEALLSGALSKLTESKLFGGAEKPLDA